MWRRIGIAFGASVAYAIALGVSRVSADVMTWWGIALFLMVLYAIAGFEPSDRKVSGFVVVVMALPFLFWGSGKAWNFVYSQAPLSLNAAKAGQVHTDATTARNIQPTGTRALILESENRKKFEELQTARYEQESKRIFAERQAGQKSQEALDLETVNLEQWKLQELGKDGVLRGNIDRLFPLDGDTRPWAPGVTPPVGSVNVNAHSSSATETNSSSASWPSMPDHFDTTASDAVIKRGWDWFKSNLIGIFLIGIAAYILGWFLITIPKRSFKDLLVVAGTVLFLIFLGLFLTARYHAWIAMQ